MIRILAEDDHLYILQRTKLEGIENLMSRRIASERGILRLNKLSELDKVLLVKLTL